MAWIESHQVVARHPKTKRLARELGVSLAEAIGYLHLLWWWAYDYAPDGDLSRYTAADIADGVGWGGDAERFLEAMKESKWIDGDTCKIHDWWEYAGKWIAKRRADTDRKKGVTPAVFQRNSSSLPMEFQQSSSGIPMEGAGTKPNLTIHNQTNNIPSTSRRLRGKREYTVEFERFWGVYPRQIEKAVAFEKWQARVRQGVDPELMITCAQNYAAHCRNEGTLPKYIKHPSTFLSDKLPFMDYIKPPEGQRVESDKDRLERLKAKAKEMGLE